MLHEDRSQATHEPVPATLNVALCCGCWLGAGALLWWAAQAPNGWYMALAALAFSFINNTIFSLLHEAVHGIAHPNRRLNEIIGTVCAAFFPTSLSLQRVSHLGHHRRNRTAVETFDYVYPDDSWVLKTVQWYGIISGVYWVVVVLGWMIYALCPFLLKADWIRQGRMVVVEHSSGGAYARGFGKVPGLRARLELLFTVSFQLTLFWALDLTIAAWLCCYLAFGINWSALQYTDHAFSPLDVTEGAWDLHAPTWLRSVFLNYHLHLAHHRHPATPWLYLPRYVDNDRERPSFFVHYLRMWKGPRAAPGPPAPALED